MLPLLFTLLTLANASPETTTSLISLAVSLSTSSPSKLDYAGGLLHNAYQLIPADNNASHLAAFNDARSTLLSLRNDTFTSTIDFSTSSSEALTSEQDVKPLPFFVPYYICTSTTIPFFFYDFDCDGSNSIPNGEMLPVVMTIMVKPRRRKDDGKWVFHFGEGDVDRLCTEEFGQYSDHLLSVCRFHLSKLLSRELATHTMESTTPTYSWVGGHGDVELRYSNILEGLDRLTIKEMEGKESGQEGNVWHTNGWNDDDTKDPDVDVDIQLGALEAPDSSQWLSPKMLMQKRRCLTI